MSSNYIKILGCDPSLTDHGWSVILYDLEGKEPPRLLDSGRIKTNSKQLTAKRYKTQRDGFIAVCEEHKPDYIGMEVPPHSASWSAGLYPIWTMMSIYCLEQRIPYATWYPPTLKSLAKSHLNQTEKVSKSDMEYFVRSIYSTSELPKRINHNIADSICVNYLTWLLFRTLLDETSRYSLTEQERYLITDQTFKKNGSLVREGQIHKEGNMYFLLNDSKYDDLI